VTGENGIFSWFQNYQRIAKMGYLSLIILGVVVAGATAYLPHEKVRTSLTVNWKLQRNLSSLCINTRLNISSLLDLDDSCILNIIGRFGN
jgi:hypothetical protein